MELHGYYDEVHNSKWRDIAASASFDCDIVHLDFNSFTIHQYLTNVRLHTLVTNVFLLGPDFVIITDSAISRMGFHKAVYAQYDVHGRDVTTILHYSQIFDRIMRINTRYRVAAGYHHRGATYYLLVPDDRDIFASIVSAPKDAAKYFRRIDAS
jgi:hypothetical protein